MDIAVSKTCYLKRKTCSQQDLLYNIPSVHTYTKGLNSRSMIGFLPDIYGYTRMKGYGCSSDHASQFDVTAVECAIKCNHDVNCASFVTVISMVRTNNPSTYVCYLNKENCTMDVATLNQTVEGVYTYFKTGTSVDFGT